jgi:carotenoid cleavage dioxygenase
VFHPMNAYDDGDAIVVDVPRHPTMFATEGELVEGPNRGGAPALHRWTIDRSAGKVRDELVDERGQEFPRVNETLLMSKHRYGYAVMVDTADAFDGAQYLKHDFDRGTSEVHEFGAGRAPAEFVFVPARSATSEDDGWLMGFVYDAPTDSSDLVILDAHDFTGPPVARVHLPQRVPFGFHGNWIPDAG